MPRVLKVYLRILNPKDFGSEHNLREFINQGKVTGDALDIAMEADGIQPMEPEQEAAAQEWYNKYEKLTARFRGEQNRYLFEQARGGEGYDDLLVEAAQELASQARGRLETAGHDGIHYKNVVEGGTAWVAFAPIRSRAHGHRSLILVTHVSLPLLSVTKRKSRLVPRRKVWKPKRF